MKGLRVALLTSTLIALAKAEAPASVIEKVVEESEADQESGTTLESVLGSFDKDKDGKLSTDEIFVQEDDMTPEQKENRDVMSANFRKNILPKIDTNGDSLISKEEFPSLLQWQQHAVTHRQLDTNSDGKLSEEEVLKPMKAQKPDELEQMKVHFRANMKKVDTDGDSLISLDEMPALVASSEEFATKRRDLENAHLLHDLDENRDGKLSREEIFKQHRRNRPEEAKKMLEHFDGNLHLIDTDGDSLISVAEIPALIALSADYEQIEKAKKEEDDGEKESDDENDEDEDDEDDEEENEDEDGESSDEDDRNDDSDDDDRS